MNKANESFIKPQLDKSCQELCKVTLRTRSLIELMQNLNKNNSCNQLGKPLPTVPDHLLASYWYKCVFPW